MRKTVRLIRSSEDGPVSLPKMLFEPGYARRLEAEHDDNELVGGEDADILRGGSGDDHLGSQDEQQDSHWFSLPTTGEDEEIVVTGRKMVPDSHKYVLVDGRYHPNPHFDPPFDITLGQAIALPALAAGAEAIPEIATIIGAGRALSRLEENARLRGNEALAQHYAKPYPRSGMGEHVVPRRYAIGPLSSALIDSRLNVLKPAAISNGAMLQLHYNCDRSYHGGPLPRSVMERGWSGRREGLERHGPLRWAWDCTTPAMKIGAGVASTAAGAGLYEALGRKDDKAGSSKGR